MGGSGFGSSEMAAESSLPWTEFTGLRAEVQPGSVDLLSLDARGSTKPSMIESR